ncbi:MAG: sigma-B regulation protein RsbU (phosphoserine phosphatase) [Cyclobacteriaceae bacterium]|jgi:serine phosphatase RsbU (regulator of sigma subunit)
MTQKLKIRLSFLAGLLSWLLFAFFDLYALFVAKYELKVNLSELLPQIFLTTFILSTLTFYRYKITKADSINFLDLLWRVFITGLVTTIGSLIIRLFFYVFANSAISKNPITINFFYHLLVGLVIIFLISTFVVWKRLILYQKSKNLLQLWGFFEYALLGSMIFDFFGNQFFTVNFNTVLIFLSSFALILSFNLKWIAYLNFKQKWKSILFILLSGIYVYHFLLNLTNFSSTNELSINLIDRVYINAIFVFIILYAGISILVTLFNLPTSSVFEQKLKEAIDFQKLSQSIPSGQSENQTYDILLDSSMSAVFADAAFLKLKNNDNILSRNIDQNMIKEVHENINNNSAKEIISFNFNGDFSNNKVSTSLRHSTFKSIITMPIMVKGSQHGVLVLLQEVADAFNREMVDIIVTFVSQASISIENFTLISEAIENERYQEQLKIAKTVQNSLLPSKLNTHPDFEIVAESHAAEEVGGDYYDMVESQDGIFNFIIGDVSGKGTSAAFNMAQMKGIFHSLVLQNGKPAEFIMLANAALGMCLEKSSFITASYFQIDTIKKKLCHVRAGHCPALYFSRSTNKIQLLESNGLGLGILRNSEYNDFVKEETLTYHNGDILLAYTDGITEARNADNKLYGIEGLKTSLVKHTDCTAEEIKQRIIDDLQVFLGDLELDDDYTLSVMKFDTTRNG